MLDYHNNMLTIIAGTFGAIGVSTIAGATAWYWSHMPKSCKPLLDIAKQSREIDKETGEHVSLFCKDGKLVEFPSEDLTTLDKITKKGLQLSNDGNIFGWRTDANSPYSWIKYSQFIERAHHIGSAFINYGLKPGANNFVAIYSINRLEWVLAEHGCYMYSMVLVALYDTLGPDACNYILLQTEAKIVVCDTIKRARIVIDNCIQHHNPYLKTIVLVEDLDHPSNETEKDALMEDIQNSQNTIKIVSWKDFEEDGRKNPKTPVSPKPDDLCSVCYTSGTTGNPKGVMLTHKNLLSMCAGLICHFDNMLNPNTVNISFLPLAHMLERVVEMNVIMHGGRIGFFSGHIRNLSQDMKILKPTLFPTVPRMLNKMHDKVTESLRKSWIKSMIFKVALKAKEEEIKRGIIRDSSPWDAVFAPIRAELGGAVRFIAVGSAPLSPQVMTFARCVLGNCVILEGYGQTECGGVCTLQVPGDFKGSSVGPPLPCNKIKMCDVPDMGYEYGLNGKGEICVKGPNVSQGYYKEPELTAQTIDKDGWLHTGDIGKWLPNGTLSIIDRKKNIFKLSQGEFVAPERIEGIYAHSHYVAQIFVYGESIKSCLIAVVVPNEHTVLTWASKQINHPHLKEMADSLGKHFTVSGSDLCGGTRKIWAEICKDQVVKQLILDDMKETGKKQGLQGFEQIKDIHLNPDMFSVENNLLTPTMKAKRGSLARFFKPQLQNMYSNLD
ncbi:unnamed protein product [Gordionus sp. m RMFG-2023]|uniref:long-chain-fatty-acid--CoA ligase 5-like n=1 Tax=Gordionus sp. m RMFG-2023 TaxID=3053472 RepID=UPI0030DE494A